MSQNRVEYVFTGHVQGVGFRMTMQRLAHRHGLAGWVRNERDGTVRSIVGGSPSQQSGLLEDLHMALPGHIHAVDELRASSRDPLPMPFEILT